MPPLGRSAGTLSLAASVIPQQALLTPLLRRSAGTLSLAASVSPRQAVPTAPSWEAVLALSPWQPVLFPGRH